MTRLHQIIALESGARTGAAETISRAQQVLARTPQIGGITRTYEPKDDSGDRLPDESTQVQIKADEVLGKVTGALAHMYDLVATKEQADTTAFADVRVGNQVLLERVPVTFLLFLEKQLAALRGFVSRLPVLDPAHRWNPPDEARDVWATDPVKTTRTEKTKKGIVLYAATKEHPANVLAVDEDIVVGTWTTTKLSGAFPQVRVDQLVARCDELIAAVKMAREEANSVQVDDVRYAARIFDHILRQ